MSILRGDKPLVCKLLFLENVLLRCMLCKEKVHVMLTILPKSSLLHFMLSIICTGGDKFYVTIPPRKCIISTYVECTAWGKIQIMLTLVSPG